MSTTAKSKDSSKAGKPPKSPVKRPKYTAATANPEESALFDKLVEISLKYDKTQHQEALEAISELRKESELVAAQGVSLKNFAREITR